jgi:2-iminoacetate synthase
MNISLSSIQSVLDNDDPRFLENLARESRGLTRQYFGRAVSLYAPLYLSNFCSSECVYCGFKNKNRISRFKLTPEQTRAEMKHLAGKGIENVLLLTGESYKVTPNAYLTEAIQTAKLYFSATTLEVHPMEESGYRAMFEAGADGVTIYQETYDRRRYAEVHLSGVKADYDFRYHAPERAARAGMRTISLGILLGLSPGITQDLSELYAHLRRMERHYPGVEYSLSFPRFRPVKGADFPGSARVDDKTFIKIICLTRALFPRVGINLSTREDARLRDHALELGVTRISAGSNTAVGGYTQLAKERQDPQFDVEDTREVADIVRVLKDKNLDPVFTDWRRIENTAP